MNYYADNKPTTSPFIKKVLIAVLIMIAVLFVCVNVAEGQTPQLTVNRVDSVADFTTFTVRVVWVSVDYVESRLVNGQVKITGQDCDLNTVFYWSRSTKRYPELFTQFDDSLVFNDIRTVPTHKLDSVRSIKVEGIQ